MTSHIMCQDMRYNLFTNCKQNTEKHFQFYQHISDRIAFSQKKFSNHGPGASVNVGRIITLKFLWTKFTKTEELKTKRSWCLFSMYIILR